MIVAYVPKLKATLSDDICQTVEVFIIGSKSKWLEIDNKMRVFNVNVAKYFSTKLAEMSLIA